MDANLLQNQSHGDNAKNSVHYSRVGELFPVSAMCSHLPHTLGFSLTVEVSAGLQETTRCLHIPREREYFGAPSIGYESS